MRLIVLLLFSQARTTKTEPSMSAALIKPTVIPVTLLFSLSLCWFSENFGIDIDNTGKKVEFYPASLMLSHNVQPVLFFSNTKIMHLVTKLKVIPPGPKLKINDTCSLSKKNFYDKLLSSIHHTQIQYTGFCLFRV